VALAAEAARALMASGADVLTGTAQMVVGAIGAARAKRVPWFATQANQAELAPEIVVASQVYKWDVILKKIIDDLDKGVMGGKKYQINLNNGGIVIEFNDRFKLDPKIKELGLKTIAGVKDGSIKTGL